MKTPAKKATKTAAKVSAKGAAPSKTVSVKSPVKAKPPVRAAKAVVSKAKPKASANPLAAAKPTLKKASAKTASVKNAPASKVPAKKVSASKTLPAKKTPPNKTPAKKPPAKKPPAKKTPDTQVLAKKGQPVQSGPVKKSTVSQSHAASSARSTAPGAAVQPKGKPQAPDASPKLAPVQLPAPATDLPARSSRPSARLAQITVPSMPQAVASTAAKASFLPQMTTTVLPVAAAPTKKDPKLANNWKSKPAEQLSDAEVLAMPDSEYMNDVQMAFFRLKLVQLKQGILNNAGETTEHLREDTVVVPDPADRATIEEEHALELRTRDRERKLLKKIEQSIARIDAGDYGYCDETGEPIGVGRLLARPTATLSLEAQQRRELKQKMFGD